jgi:hypothetical protein
MSGREQIRQWMQSASACEDVSGDLLANGHALAAAYWLNSESYLRGPAVGDIISGIEQATDDADAVVTGFALSRVVWLRDLTWLTGSASRLRRGYIYRKVNNYGYDVNLCKNADAQLLDALTLYRTKADASGLASVSEDALGCVLCDDAPTHLGMINVACNLAASDTFHPEFALFFALAGLRASAFAPAENIIDIYATMIADAFERRQSLKRSLALPPVIV